MANPVFVSHNQYIGTSNSITLSGGNTFSDRVLIVITGNNGDSSVDSVAGAVPAASNLFTDVSLGTSTYSNGLLSLVGQYSDSGGVEAPIAIYDMQGLGAGSFTLSLTRNGTTWGIYVVDIYEFSNGGPVSNFAHTPNISNQPTTFTVPLTTSGALGDLVISGAFAGEGNQTGATLTDDASLATFTPLLSGTYIGGQGYTTLTSANQVITYSFTGLAISGGQVDRVTGWSVMMPLASTAPTITGVTFDSTTANGDIAGGNLTGPTNVALQAGGVTSNITSGLTTATSGDVTFPVDWGNLPFYDPALSVTITASSGTSTPYDAGTIPVPVGYQVIVSDSTIDTSTYSIFPQTAVAGDQARIPLITAGGGVITPDLTLPNSGLVDINYSSVGSTPSTDTFTVEYWDSVNLLRYAAVTYTISNGSFYVSSVSVPTAGTYVPGNALNFTVNFNYAATVTGTPRIPITIGSNIVYATYQSGSGTTALVFSYTILATDDTDLNGITVGSAIDLNSGTITQTDGYTLDLTLNNIGTTSAVLVQTSTSVTSVTGPSNGRYGIGEVLSFTVNTDSAWTVNTGIGTPQIPVTIGTNTVSANYQSGSGTTALVFSYTIQAGDSGLSGISLGAAISDNSNSISESTGKTVVLTLNNVSNFSSVIVDTNSYGVSSVLFLDHNGIISSEANISRITKKGTTLLLTETVQSDANGYLPVVDLTAKYLASSVSNGDAITVEITRNGSSATGIYNTTVVII